jgi:peptidoglycan/LPS O-acetylase OafA/YrhL
MGDMIWLLLLLLLAFALGILGAVIKVALIIVLAVILAFLILGAVTYYYLRHRVRKFSRELERRQSAQPPEASGGPPRGYPTSGEKRPGPSLPE